MGYKEEIVKFIKDGESDSRSLGVEIEHFVVDDKGFQIDFHKISSIIKETAGSIGAEILYMDGFAVGYASDDYTITLEPSCQFEISISPYEDIADIKKAYEKFLDLWTPILASYGYHIETFGNLPLVEKGLLDPDDIPLSPKKRYIYMDKYFRKSGRYGKYMMRASGSTQISIDFKSESDMARKLKVLQIISPILMIAMESKSDPTSTLKDHPDKPHLFRIQEWDDLDEKRTGFYPRSFEPGFGYDSVADTILNTPLILLTDEGVTTDVGSLSAEDLINSGLIREDFDPDRKTRLIEHFISMGFFHFRIKKFIEIRVADGVPLDRALGYAALIKGIVYSDESLSLLETEFKDIDSPSKIQEAVEAIEEKGYDAIVYGRPASDWAALLYKTAVDRLPSNEKEYLKNVRTFWGII